MFLYIVLAFIALDGFLWFYSGDERYKMSLWGVVIPGSGFYAFFKLRCNKSKY